MRALKSPTFPLEGCWGAERARSVCGELHREKLIRVVEEQVSILH